MRPAMVVFAQWTILILQLLFLLLDSISYTPTRWGDEPPLPLAAVGLRIVFILLLATAGSFSHIFR